MKINEIKAGSYDETGTALHKIQRCNKRTYNHERYLYHDLHCKNADEMYSEVLAQRVTELKETAEGSESMCEALEKLVQEFVQEGELRGETRGEVKKAKETAKALNQEGMSAEKIAQVLREDEETVRNWLTHE